MGHTPTVSTIRQVGIVEMCHMFPAGCTIHKYLPRTNASSAPYCVSDHQLRAEPIYLLRDVGIGQTMLATKVWSCQ